MYAAAQVAVAAADRLKSKQSHAVYALCRPPGHHATCNAAGGNGNMKKKESHPLTHALGMGVG